jgi:hypothetical protein
MPAAAHGTFDDVLASASPALRPVCVALRRMIAARHAKFTQVVWPSQRIASFGMGPKKMSEHYAYIAVYAAHVNLGFYHGTALVDRAGLLEGSGAMLRHISFRDVPSTRRPAVAALLRQAIAERRRHAGPAKVARRTMA